MYSRHPIHSQLHQHYLHFIHLYTMPSIIATHNLGFLILSFINASIYSRHLSKYPQNQKISVTLIQRTVSTSLMDLCFNQYHPPFNPSLNLPSCILISIHPHATFIASSPLHAGCAFPHRPSPKIGSTRLHAAVLGSSPLHAGKAFSQRLSPKKGSLRLHSLPPFLMPLQLS